MNTVLNPDLDFLLDDIGGESEPGPPVGAPWRVMVVDDDESVHSISRVVLSDIQFQGRSIDILSAYSAQQAASLLRRTEDVAVVLLDVVMEDDNAGLRLVKEIREEIGNTQLRIILRTGQPGQAPEREVIINYDINDYKSKTELTAQKLFTATIAALRSYSDIVALERSRHGLARIIGGAPELFARHSAASFAATLLRQITDLSGQAGEGAVVLAMDEGGEAPPVRVVAASGAFAAAQDQAYQVSLPGAVAAPIAAALDRGAAWTAGAEIVRPIRTPGDHRAALYYRAPAALDADRLALIDITCALGGVGLDNVHLHSRLLRHQARLEGEVEARTRELAAKNADLLHAQSQVNEELRVARELQQSILPTQFPPHAAYHGHAFMRAARMIGGDFYDIFALDDHRLGLVVADVSGKGVPAALFMVLVRTILQDLAMRGLPPGACLAEANRQLIARNPLSMFVTVVYGVMDVRSGLFTFCSGGHLMPYVLRADGSAQVVTGRAAPMLGLIEEARYAECTVELAPGDGILLLTDGVIECFNLGDEAFGEERLLQFLAAAGTLPVERLLDGLIQSLNTFSADCPVSDDVTALVVRYTGAA